MSSSKLSLLLSVDDRRPEEGGNVNFSLTARNDNASARSGYIELIADARVKVELSEGLRFKDGWTPPTTFVKSGNLNQSATWSPPGTDTNTGIDIGNLFEQSHDIVIETQLTPGVSLETTPLEERCITARVDDSVPPPAPTYVLGSLKQCLGDDPQIMFKDGEIDLLYLYPCATATTTAYPCRDDNSDNTVDNGLELVVSSDVTRQFAPRAQGIGRSDSDANKLYFRPKDVVVRVDPEARVDTKWYSGSDEDSGVNAAGLIPGALLHLDFLGADWKPYTFAVSDVSPKKRPGSLSILRMDNTTFEILNADTKKTLGPVNSNLDMLPLVLVFGTLGTYQVSLTMGGTNGGTAYTSTGQYTFHVGPVAELEVRDGGASPHASAGQNALTIVAANNGPDDSLTARVTGLPTGAAEIYKSQGTYDAANGVWDIGELKVREHLLASGQPGHATLVLAADASDTADVTIENSVKYEVCIGSDGSDLDHDNETDCEAVTGASWHSTSVYDYISANNTATITATEGPGGVGPGAPELPGADDEEEPVETSRASVTVRWKSVPTVNGVAVSHYQVERGTNPWEGKLHRVEGTTYVDTDVQPGEAFKYRVRAVNLADVEGPWSADVEARAPALPRASAPTGTSGGDGNQGSGSSRSSRSSDDDDDDYTHFAALETTRAVAENSAAGAAVGNPVVAQANPGNRVTYYLEGKDAARFDIEPDTGQILVGEDLVLDREGGPDTYTVVVVADPRRGSRARVTVTINVIDAAETARLVLSPEGTPAVGRELTASVEHSDGKVTVASWQWKRSADGENWQTIAGADSGSYTPTGADAGHRLRVIVLYRPPGDAESLALTGLVTPPLPGEAATTPETGPDADSEAGPVTDPEAPSNVEAEGRGPGTDLAPTAPGVALLPGGDPATGDPVIAYLVGNRDGLVWSRWEWQRSRDGVSWQDIAGAEGDYYEPTMADAGHFLRVIFTYVPVGSLEAVLAGAVTERMPGMPVVEMGPEATSEATSGADSGAKSGTAQGSSPQPEPTSLPTSVPTATPLTATPIPAPAPTPESTSMLEQTATATVVPSLTTASRLAARGVRPSGSTDTIPPPDGVEGATQTPQGQPSQAAAAPGGQNGMPLEEPPSADPGAPDAGAGLAAEQGGRGIMVWVVMGIFALLVVGSGLTYYNIRMRRR
ncbi:MAG: hypothetical protein F4X65_01505 [Chloroflexi bacterium]|nr:hypothetical protein [Chloroflexota bacterium]